MNDGRTGGRTDRRARLRTVLSLVLLSVCPSARLPAQSLGFAPAGLIRQDSIERRLIALADTASVRAMSKDLAAQPHMAGTPAQATTRDYALTKTRGWGLESWSKEYTVYLPQPDTVALWMFAGSGGQAQALDLREPALPDDPSTQGPQVPSWNGYSGDGDVTAELVYVNYGLIEDYATLDSLGISVRGKIAVARYGRSFRGIKAREAERNGAVGLIMYSDPWDDGYFRGDVYPGGPMRPAGSIQRGSVMNGNGDPMTPGWASVPGARRLPEDSLPIPRIPVIPIGFGNAQRLLAALAGPSVPQAWQGSLPFRYHLGAGPTRARLLVRTERGPRAQHRIWNTFALVRGAVYPDEWVVVGAHRDAWSPGARDNVSGTVSVLEAARLFAELSRQGVRPARTIVFATWDAEEWGLIGSTEWVEELADSLRRHAVAYLNEDGTFSGPTFGGAGSPSLKRLIREATRAVPDPGGAGTVYDAWLKRQRGDTAQLSLGNLGGGSDFAGFYHHLGIPSGGIGFDGPYGVYHSMYDSYRWMTRFGDSAYQAHQAGARLVSVLLARLANADILPLDYVGFGLEMTQLVSQLDSGITQKRMTVSTAPLREALGRFTESARRFEAARTASLAGRADRRRWATANRALMQVERALTRPQGLASRSWSKSLQFASDVDNGYATMAFPTVNEAIRYADAATVEREIADLIARIDAARARIEEATRALAG
jgi:N-acetylated-alpha-linked acidic dipeptidase